MIKKDIALKGFLYEIDILSKGRMSPKTVRLVIENIISEIEYIGYMDNSYYGFVDRILPGVSTSQNYEMVFKEIIKLIKYLLRNVDMDKDFFSFMEGKNVCVLTQKEMEHVVKFLQDLAINIRNTFSNIESCDVDKNFFVTKNLVELEKAVHSLIILWMDLKSKKDDLVKRIRTI